MIMQQLHHGYSALNKQIFNEQIYYPRAIAIK